MTADADYYDWLAKYARGELSDDELREFRDRLSQDPELQQELDTYLALRVDYQIGQKLRFRELIREQTLTPEKPPGRLKQLWDNTPGWSRIAASLLLLCILGYLLWPSGPRVHQLALNYLSEPYPSPTVVMGDVAAEAHFEEGRIAYEQGNFADAAQAFQQSLDTGNNSDELRFYLGLSCLYQEPARLGTAIAQLSLVDGIYKEAADWYQALALIQSEQFEEAIPLLESMKDPQRQSKARKLLNAISATP